MLLINAKMPQACSECWFAARTKQHGVDYYLCIIPEAGTNQPRYIGKGLPILLRPECCPLSEISEEDLP